ncbi:Vacuolar fusion protein MON1 [Candida viswanathii]|uniref:Vacuolar fusion protein MON1 n=1 Tax=Candida viswanathii TaxID=5486 RepID=A0A367XZQ0_9ASCO|nr:Vacuolar fusion protein MON1 [Candida viswanathii]
MSLPKTLQVPGKASALIPKTTAASTSATQPTTAISYANASLEIQSIRGSPYIAATPVPSQAPDTSSIISEIGLSEYVDDLNSIPHIRFDNTTSNRVSPGLNGSSPESFTYREFFQLGESGLTNEQFHDKYIGISKSNDDKEFHDKLKHFFIFSSAGKPIYSMNGSDDLIIGYMGILTTIISSFQENFNQDLQVIEFDRGMKVVAINKNPIILIAISRIYFENIASMKLQLNTLYYYLLSILSKSAIDKHFNNRLNYDLRRVLSPLDFENLDQLCMNLTYGVRSGETGGRDAAFELYISQILLASARQSIKVRHTLRTKLNSILHVKNEEIIFTLLMSRQDKILNYLHPKQHNLPNEDLNVLLFIINSLPKRQNRQNEDLWMPICMSNFNDHGFLYIFVRHFNDLTLMLISGNKNAFDTLKLTADEIFDKLDTKPELTHKLRNELNMPLNIEAPLIFRHFIYKDIPLNQFVMSELPSDEYSSLQYIKIYNELKFNQAKIIKFDDGVNYKKLTYLQQKNAIGFMLLDKHYEFHCIIDNIQDGGKPLQSKKIIEISLQIIKWCKKNHARLFVTI